MPRHIEHKPAPLEARPVLDAHTRHVRQKGFVRFNKVCIFGWQELAQCLDAIKKPSGRRGGDNDSLGRYVEEITIAAGSGKIGFEVQGDAIRNTVAAGNRDIKPGGGKKMLLKIRSQIAILLIGDNDNLRRENEHAVIDRHLHGFGNNRNITRGDRAVQYGRQHKSTKNQCNSFHFSILFPALIMFCLSLATGYFFFFLSLGLHTRMQAPQL